MTLQGGQRGLTVVELAIAAVLSLVLMAAVMMFTRTGQVTVETVREETHASRSLRAAVERIAADVRQCGAPRMAIVVLPDGNHAVTLQMPISAAGGAPTWGVDDAALGARLGASAHAGWSVRYTVVDVTENGEPRKHLVRQTLDDSGVVQRREVLLRDVRPGAPGAPGFRIEPNGAMWTVTVSTRARGNVPLQRVQFDLSLRN